MFGQAVTMLLVPLIPAEAVFMRGYSPHEIVRQIRSRRISLAAGHGVGGATEEFTGKFWVFISGAAPLEPELEEFWSRLGFLVVQGYGLTQTAPIVSFNNPFAVRKGTVGRPVEGTEIKIAADSEILVRGESVTPGYYGVPPEASSAFSEGWLHTGDIGRSTIPAA